MSTRRRLDGKLLVASDSVANAGLVTRLLQTEFQQVASSTDAERAAADFQREQPDVLVLAFHDIRHAQQHYLSIYRHGEGMQRHPHRTVLLCSKDELREAYALCREDLFDDYVLFWPVAHDAQRLSMAVHHALRELHARRGEQPSASEFAASARDLHSLERAMRGRIARDQELVRSGEQAGARAAGEMHAAFDGFTRRTADAGTYPHALALQRELETLKEEALALSRRAVDDSVRPLREQAEEFRQACEAHLKAVQKLAEMAQRMPPLVLVVDDDPLQRDMLEDMLHRDYRLMFAGSGMVALGLLRERRPDLILLDVLMPGMSGVEVLRQIRSSEDLRDIPVIMVSGRSEKETVVQSLGQGARDFVAKPFEPATLLAKLDRVLRGVAETTTSRRTPEQDATHPTSGS